MASPCLSLPTRPPHHCPADAFRVLSVLRRCPVPCIALAMGERGQITRLLAPKYGGFLTFGALSPDRASGGPAQQGEGCAQRAAVLGENQHGSLLPVAVGRSAWSCSCSCCVEMMPPPSPAMGCAPLPPPAAPGQPTLQQLSGMYGLKQQRRDTEVFGIVGNPVSHR